MTEDEEPGVISMGFTRGISLTVFQSSQTTTQHEHEEHDRQPVEGEALRRAPEVEQDGHTCPIGRAAPELKLVVTSVTVVNRTPAWCQAARQAAVRSSSSPRDASSTNVDAPPASEKAPDRGVVADVGGHAEDDHLLRVEQVEEPVGVRVGEDVEVLLQEQELRPDEPAARGRP